MSSTDLFDIVDVRIELACRDCSSSVVLSTDLSPRQSRSCCLDEICQLYLGIELQLATCNLKLNFESAIVSEDLEHIDMLCIAVDFSACPESREEAASCLFSLAGSKDISRAHMHA